MIVEEKSFKRMIWIKTFPTIKNFFRGFCRIITAYPNHEVACSLWGVHVHHRRNRIMQRGEIEIIDYTYYFPFYAKTILHLMAYGILPTQKICAGLIDYK